MDTNTNTRILLDHFGPIGEVELRSALEDGELLGALMVELGLTDQEMQAAVEDIYPAKELKEYKSQRTGFAPFVGRIESLVNDYGTPYGVTIIEDPRGDTLVVPRNHRDDCACDLCRGLGPAGGVWDQEIWS